MKHNWENYFDISSEYWKKVEKIYEENESFPKKVVKYRNLHHKFPRSFSKKDGVDIDNDEDNLVSISLADHFRVHYYLWKCAKKGYRGMMAKAFVFMRKKAVIYASDDTVEQLAKDYEEAMKEAAEASSKAMKGHSVSAETRKKLSEANKGHTVSEEAKKKMSTARKGKYTGEDNSFYGRHHSDNTRNKLSEANKGKHIGADNPFYGKHHTEEAKKKMSKARKGKYAGETHPMYGKHHTDEAKKKMSTAKKGMRWFNNGKINKFCFECPPGFVPGRIK